MLIVTNFSSFPAEWSTASGERGQSVTAYSLGEFVRHSRRRDAVLLVNGSPRLLLQLAALFLAAPFLRRPVISVDLVLRKPAGGPGLTALRLKRWLFSRVDHYIHYFRDLRGYQETFGIGPATSSFTPFKVNLHGSLAADAGEGDYVLCLGRSMRDFDTFFDAMERLPYPGAISPPDVAVLRAHGARFTRPLDRLPSNIRILDDDGSEAAQIRMLSGARLIVLPILKASMVASGISTCLNGMSLGRCIIASEGPGISDVFSNELLMVPPEDPAALAEAIRCGWEDHAVRARLAAAGRQYAARAGGEKELYQRIIDQVAAWNLQRG